MIALVSFVIAHQLPAKIRRDDMCGSEVPDCKCRFSTGRWAA